MVKIDHGSNTIVLGELGSRMTNGEYTVALDEDDPFVTEDDLGTEASHAGWSLIIIYSDPDPLADAHQLYLYDNFTFVSNYAENFDDPDTGEDEGYLEFPIIGFQAPENFNGILTCFVGEGDPHYGDHRYAIPPHTLEEDEDYIELNGYRLPCIDDPYDPNGNINSQNNVWNGVSSVPGIEGSGEGEGIDIDAFWIQEPVVDEGDTAATLRIDTGVDGFNIVYIFLSFKTVPTEESGQAQVGVVTFGY